MADFQSLKRDFDAEDVTILAGSVDPSDKTEQFVRKTGITYPVAYGLDLEETCRATGAFYNEKKRFIQPTCFLLRPDRNIEVATYSSGTIGRFVAKDTLSLIQFYKARAKK